MSSVHSHGDGDDPARVDFLDAETAALMAKLALQDLEEVGHLKKGKSRADAPLSDEEMAHQLQLETFEQLLMFSVDVNLAKSLNSAIETDLAYLEAVIAAEAAAEDDRIAAQALSRGEALPPPTNAQRLLERPEFVMHPECKLLFDTGNDLEAMNTIYDDNVFHLESYNAQNRSQVKESGPGPSGSNKVESNLVDCVICTGTLKAEHALYAPCKHFYCPTCVTSLVTAFLTDESLYPLRCCQEPIPVETANQFLKPALRDRFKDKNEEFSIAPMDRVYCTNPTCSAFLGAGNVVEKSTIECTVCKTVTCKSCKEVAHGEENCSSNSATVAVRAMARAKGWQTCPGCGTVVELSLGCYHMTCRCRTQFCYLCSALWKNCKCAQWDESRLVADAERRVQNELGARQFAQMVPEVRERRVRRRAEVLRYDHDCYRHVWRHRNGGGDCEECHHYLPDFLKICKNCSILACVRCTKNRL